MQNTRGKKEPKNIAKQKYELALFWAIFYKKNIAKQVGKYPTTTIALKLRWHAPYGIHSRPQPWAGTPPRGRPRAAGA